MAAGWLASGNATERCVAGGGFVAVRGFGGELAGMARAASGWDERDTESAAEMVGDGACEVEGGVAGAGEFDADCLGEPGVHHAGGGG